MRGNVHVRFGGGPRGKGLAHGQAPRRAAYPAHARHPSTRLKQTLPIPHPRHRASSTFRPMPSGPFTSRVSNLSLGSSGPDASSTRLTRHTSACFRSRAPGPVSGQLYVGHPAEEPVVLPSLSRCPFGCRHSLLGRPIPATEFCLPCGWPTTPSLRCGPDGVPTFHTSETRPGRVPSVPREQRCPHDRR
jgi:hypothetical protein